MPATSTTIPATTVTSTRTTTRKRSSAPRRDHPRWPLAAAAAWTLFAFAGLYAWTLVPLALVAVAGLLLVRPHIAVRRTRALDVAMLISLVAVLLQIVPVSDSLRAVLSPHASEVDHALRLDVANLPVSIAPSATLLSLAYVALLAVMFWVARGTFERGGVRATAHRVAWIGLLVSVVAIVQLATSPRLLYGTWRPADASARPFGPFVNRNHMATWLILAIPLSIGGAMARAKDHVAAPTRRQRPVVAIAGDATTVWLLGASGVMMSALFVSVSRSGILGLAAAALAGAALARARLGYLPVKWMAIAAALVLLIVTYMANFDALSERFIRAMEFGTERTEIWRQTWRVVHDFAVTGTGVGTFRRAMLVYQTGNRALLFNQAHNQYLQLAAEGGLLVGVPVAWTFVTALVSAARQLKRDATSTFWLRAGAVAGIAGVAVQGLWETGLTMPANGVLLAIVAAVALHDRGSVLSPGDRRL